MWRQGQGGTLIALCLRGEMRGGRVSGKGGLGAFFVLLLVLGFFLVSAFDAVLGTRLRPFCGACNLQNWQ